MRRNSAARALAALAAAALLAACAAPGLPLGPSVTVPASDFAAVQGQADVVVRAFVAGPEDARREVGGARCEVISILFAVPLTTPARLVFPGFGPQSPTLSVACRAGDLTGRAEQAVVTRWLRAPGAWPGPGPWGLPYGGGASVWGGGWGWNAPAVAVFVYPDIDVSLR